MHLGKIVREPLETAVEQNGDENGLVSGKIATLQADIKKLSNSAFKQMYKEPWKAADKQSASSIVGLHHENCIEAKSGHQLTLSSTRAGEGEGGGNSEPTKRRGD